MADTTTPAAAILAAAAALGVTMSAVFVPFSQSRNAKPRDGQDKPWRSLNWTVTLERNGRPFITTDYSQGEGHAPAYKRDWVGGRNDKAAAITLELENGRHAGGSTSHSRPFATSKPIAPPALDEVLYSLISDASVLDSAGFEDWAAEYGYDPDSRSAEKTYRACLETALKIRAAIGEAGIDALRVAGEDY